MSMATAVVSFGEWLPDQPALGNQGLTVATNVLPIEAGYGPFSPLNANLGTLPTTVGPSFIAYDASNYYVYAQAPPNVGGIIYEATVGASFTGRSATVSAVSAFCQFDHLVIASRYGDVPLAHTIGSASNFANLATSTVPASRCMGVVNRFIAIGNLLDSGVTREAVLRWNAIDAPSNWPTPNSATAVATQAGEQTLGLENGAVMAIHGGDQYAVVLQRYGVVRMTYVGPPVVFQFDLIDNTHGLRLEKGSVQVGRIIYYVSDVGLCRTDGVSVERIGFGKVDKYFRDAVASGTNVVSLAHEPKTGLIYIGFNNPATSVVTYLNNILVFNPADGRFALANQDSTALVSPKPTLFDNGTLLGFDSSNRLGKFNGTPGTATITTGDLELNPGGRGFVGGVKPNIEASGAAPAVTVRVGSRSDLISTPNYTATTTPTTRTGVADFRVDAKYHRAEVQIVGNFDKAVGLEFNPDESGEA